MYNAGDASLAHLVLAPDFIVLIWVLVHCRVARNKIFVKNSTQKMWSGEEDANKAQKGHSESVFRGPGWRVRVRNHTDTHKHSHTHLRHAGYSAGAV